MNRSGIIAVVLSATLLAPLAGLTESAPSLGKNVETLLQQILDNQKRMQADIDLLKTQMTQKDKEIGTLKEQILKQKTAVDEQVQAIAARPVAAATPVADRYSARVQYEVARSLEHDTIFNVRKGEQKSWFQRVITEYQKVVNGYPGTNEASDAQIHIARIYYRYLDNLAQAKIEYQKVIDNYPNSSNVKEAQNALSKMKTK